MSERGREGGKEEEREGGRKGVKKDVKDYLGFWGWFESGREWCGLVILFKKEV